jgi:hypothetical protein
MDKGSPTSLPSGLIFTPANGVESPLMLGEGINDGEYGLAVRCRFVKRFKMLATAQIILGIALIGAGLYTHFPIFSGVSDSDRLVKNGSGENNSDGKVVAGWHLVQGEDKLWYGTCIGALNLLTGVFGRLATKRSIRRSVHTTLRRSYFLLNAFLVLYCNGIGIVAYIISLTHNHSLIAPDLDRKFTSVMAFISLFLLMPLLLLNLIATVYQALATRQCRCWICDPKSRGKLLLA